MVLPRSGSATKVNERRIRDLQSAEGHKRPTTFNLLYCIIRIQHKCFWRWHSCLRRRSSLLCTTTVTSMVVGSRHGSYALSSIISPSFSSLLSPYTLFHSPSQNCTRNTSPLKTVSNASVREREKRRENSDSLLIGQKFSPASEDVCQTARQSNEN